MGRPAGNGLHAAFWQQAAPGGGPWAHTYPQLTQTHGRLSTSGQAVSMTPRHHSIYSNPMSPSVSQAKQPSQATTQEVRLLHRAAEDF